MFIGLPSRNIGLCIHSSCGKTSKIIIRFILPHVCDLDLSNAFEESHQGKALRTTANRLRMAHRAREGRISQVGSNAYAVVESGNRLAVGGHGDALESPRVRESSSNSLSVPPE